MRAARSKLGGEWLDKGATFWTELREHQRAYFTTGQPLWRLSVPPATPPLALPGKWLLDWGGAQRWLTSDAPAAVIQQAAEQVGGYARLFRHSPTTLPAALKKLNATVKTALDPQNILNPALAA